MLLFLPPIALSLPLIVVHDALVRDLVFFSASCHETSFRLTQQLAQPISSRLSTLLPILPVAVCVSSWPVSPALLATVFRVAVFSFSTSSTSWLSSSWRRTANVMIGFRVNDKISSMSRPCLATCAFLSTGALQPLSTRRINYVAPGLV